MRSVANPNRGCGNLVKGGFYGQGRFGPNGTLEVWTWCLGEGVWGGRNLNLAPQNPRGMDVIRLRETLFNLAYSTAPLAFTTEVLDRLPEYALLDHVGSAHYTPWSFANEVKRLGPSRRIHRDIAPTIAKYLPIPILFTHGWIPSVDREQRIDLMQWSGAVGEWFMEPTHEHPEWGIYAADTWHGDGHWQVPLLAELNRRCEGYKLIGNMPEPLANATLLDEAAFGISWITDVCYITTGEESDDTLQSLLDKGIEPVTIEGAEDADE